MEENFIQNFTRQFGKHPGAHFVRKPFIDPLHNTKERVVAEILRVSFWPFAGVIGLSSLGYLVYSQVNRDLYRNKEYDSHVQIKSKEHLVKVLEDFRDSL